MSMDDLEKYIRDNRDAFDDGKPSAGLWHRINRRLDASGDRLLQPSSFLWKAAAVILFAAVIWLLIDRENTADPPAIANIKTEQGFAFGEVENYYFQIIREKRQAIQNYVEHNPEVDEKILMDIDRLDSAYRELKKSMTKVPSDRILDAMVNNLQTRIELLNQQLNILERIKMIKDKENETSHT